MKNPLRFALAFFAALPCMAASPRHFDPRAAQAGPDFQSLSVAQGPPAALLAEPHDPYRLGPGDKLELELMEVADTRQVSIVMPDGDLYFQTAHVHAAGLTILELKAALEKQLDADYRDPQLSLILRSVTSRKAMVMGRVNNPGIITLDGPTTLVEAISRAGGLMIQSSGINSEELADLGHSFLVRNDHVIPVNFVKLLREGDASQNIYVKDGDFIYLPSSSSGRVYILGAVNLPRGVDYSEELTLLTAVASAEGLAPRAFPQRVVIIRDSLTEPKIAVVNLNAMLNGKAIDVRLKPQDIVWVPNSPFEKVESIVGGIFNTFARTVSVNEGVRAVLRNAQPVVPSIGIGGPP